MKKAKPNPAAKPAKGELNKACETGDTDAAKRLLDAGAEVNERGAKGMTPLLWASLNGKTSIVEKLIEKGAKLEDKDSSGLTPLDYAILFNEKTLEKILTLAAARQKTKEEKILERIADPSTKRRIIVKRPPKL